MPCLYIEEEYSHMGGLELLKLRYPYLHNEICTILTTEVSEPTKISKEKGKQGKLVWSGPAFNRPLEESFKRLSWEKNRFDLGNNRSVEIDFYKGRVGLEVQFGKYAFVAHNLFAKYLALYTGRIINVGIEILPTKVMQKEMSSGIAYYEGELHNILRHGRTNPPVPLVLIGLEP